MPTESGVDTMENQNAPIEDMFTEDKYKLEEGLVALNNRPLNPLEEVQQRLAQQYNQQQENLVGSVENVSPDKGEGMAESATVEAKQEIAIEKVAAEANQINPDFGAGVKAELKETAQQMLRMKIEAKVYDLLTNIERKVGQGIVMQRVREQFAWDKYWAKDWKAGKIPGVTMASQYKTGLEKENDVALGKRNLKYGVESVKFVPGGEVLPSSMRWPVGTLRAEKPSLDSSFNSRSERAYPSESLRSGVMTAESSVEVNPVIETLEKWRSTLRERQTSVNGAKQLVSNYGNVS